LHWNGFSNLHRSTTTAAVEFITISTTATSNSTDDNNTYTMLIEGFNSIHPVLAVSNASSWNMSKNHILDTTTIPTGISHP
jgi:hypothetical protein